ncbi:MAG: hypothetical protein NC396_01160 [Bacteroides sp.]|nr:hypothetical protein [Bacteroides sp.]MCM1085447.1 hypothetical protein [Bacteroides sp.]
MNFRCPTLISTDKPSFFNSPFLWLIWIALATIFCLMFAWTVSPLFVFEGADSSIFKIMGLGILDGKLPYRDLFDHKGPLIFYINAVALGMGGKTGLYLLSVLFLSVTLYLIYLVSCFFTSCRNAFWVSLIALLFWAIFSEGGNLVEGFMVPAIALSLYLTLRVYKNPDKVFGSYFIGLCFSWIFLLRMSDAVMQVGGLFAGLCLYGFIKKRYKKTLISILWFLAGFATLILPFVIYFAAQNALPEFWDGQFTFNYLYSQKSHHVRYNYGNTNILIFFLLSCILAVGKKKELSYLYFVFVPVAVLSYFLVGKYNFPHYYLIYMPLFSLCISLLFNKYYISLVLWILIAGCGFAHPGRNVRQSTDEWVRVLKKDKKITKVYEEAGKLFARVPDNEKNDIWCYNLVSFGWSNMGIFPHHGIVPSNRIFCCWHLEYGNLEETESIETHCPKWVVVDRTSYFPKGREYIEANYDLAFQTDTSVCKLELYRLRQN